MSDEPNNVSPLRQFASPREMVHTLLEQVDQIEHLQIVVFWKADHGGSVESGWTRHLNYGQLIYGAKLLDCDTERVVFRGEKP